MNKLEVFKYSDGVQKVEFVETIQVKEGVECDVYRFAEDEARDLALVRVAPLSKTPRQKVLEGIKTVEGFVEGSGTLTVERSSGSSVIYKFDEAVAENEGEVVVQVEEIMQWTAGPNGLIFYEICVPPYADGRYENLAETGS